MFSIRVIGSSTALSAALFAAACSLPSNLRDASVPGDGAVMQDDVAVMDDTVAPPIDVVPADTGVGTDTGVVTDTGVLTDTGVPVVCTAATVPTMIAPISTAAYATSFVTFVASAPLGSRVQFEYSSSAGFPLNGTTRVAPVPVGADGRASYALAYTAAIANRVQFVRARVVCADMTAGANTTATRLFRVGTRPMGGNWTRPIVERFELDMDADARTDVAIGLTSGGVRVVRNGGATSDDLVPTIANTSFGQSFAAAGDLNGDGFGDLLIGEPDYDVSLGRVSVYLGSNGAPQRSTISVVGGRNASMGSAVAALGDLNDDGLADFAVAHTVGADTQISIFLSPHALPLTRAQAVVVQGFVGPTAMVAGDLTNDGRAEIVIGFANVNDFVGAALVFRAADAGPMPYEMMPVRLRSGSVVGRVGASLAMGALLNDVALDLVVGAPGKASAPVAAGGLLVYPNPFVSDNASLASVFGAPVSSENFASSVSVVGDSDSDGASEFLILHPGRLTGSNRSAVLLAEFYPSGTGFLLSVHSLLTGTTSSPTFTRALSAAGAFLDSTNAGRHSLVLTVEATGVRTLNSSSLTGGGMGMAGTWTATNPALVGSLSGYTSVIASR